MKKNDFIKGIAVGMILTATLIYIFLLFNPVKPEEIVNSTTIETTESLID